MPFKLTICLILFLCSGFALKLEQVLILSRHNIRQPLTENLQQFAPDIWPVSNYKAGHLTTKGAVLEKYMGEYIGNWLKKKELLPKDCPVESSVFIYANTKQRTKETAKAFVTGAFPNCNVKVHSLNSDEMDPIFNPIIRNTSLILKDIIINEMKNNLNKIDIRNSYLELDKIVNITNSYMCKEKNFCSFSNSSDEIFYKIGLEPDLIGPLKYGNSIVDAFLMAYYEGNAIQSIACGHIKTLEQLRSLGKITHANQIVRFHSSTLAQEVAKPLLNYIYDVLSNKTKFILLMGHDSNIQTVLAAFDFKDYVLPEQIENTPIGGKLVFQKWHDEASKEQFLKVNYVYQTTKQLRDGVQLSEESPPRWIDMEILSCPTDQNGFCSWKSFLKILENIK